MADSLEFQRAEDLFDRIQSVLGMRGVHPRTPIELHELIARGLPRAAAVHLVSGMVGISLDESMRALNISRRTWHRLKGERAELDKPLDVDQSARAWRMAEILARAQEVLGTRKEGEAWLARPAIGLDGRRPIDLMSTPQGEDLVKTLLERMEYGVYA